MLSGLMRWISGPAPRAPLPELDARLAVGALLVRLAKADTDYAFEEIARIDRILCARYALDPVEAAKMRALCERFEAEAPDTERFTSMVHESVEYEERLAIYDAMWQVSMADGRLRPEEHEMMRDLGRALGIAEEDAGRTAERHQK